MNVVIVNQDEVARLLPIAECMGAMKRVLIGLARGECELPLRQIMWMPEKIGALGLMPSYWHASGVIGLKAVTFFPGNEGTELDTHQGAVLLFEAQRGRLLAIVDATAITAIRTAGVSGVATDALAKADSAELAILGSGVQARGHLEAMLHCRAIERVRVASKTFESAKRFAESAQRRCGVSVRAVDSCEEAVRGADIVCTTTSSCEPVLHGAWLKPGAHINAVGSSVATARELDGVAVKRSRLFVDRRESALNEAGDFLLAKHEGLVGDDHIVGEIGDVLTGELSGRTSPEEITLFKSVGLAVEDLAAALHVYEKAKDGPLGTSLAFGGARLETD